MCIRDRLFDNLDKFSTMDLQHSWLTAPYLSIILFLTLRILILALLEYVINPNLKYFDEPLNLVNLLDSKPPVQDSATDIVIFFLMIRRPPRSTRVRSSAASDVYKRQIWSCKSRML